MKAFGIWSFARYLRHFSTDLFHRLLVGRVWECTPSEASTAIGVASLRRNIGQPLRARA
jgi:hypothetical protein